MTPDQAAAFVNAQTAFMNAEAQVMLAENQERELAGKAPANGAEEWQRFHDQWLPILGVNAVTQLFNEANEHYPQ